MYSLGCLAFTCLAGAPPFTGSLMEVAYGHLDEDPSDPAAGRDDIPPGVSEVVLAALAKDPAQRPRSPTMLAHLLRAGAGSAATSASGRARQPTIVKALARTADVAAGVLELDLDHVSALAEYRAVPAAHQVEAVVARPVRAVLSRSARVDGVVAPARKGPADVVGHLPPEDDPTRLGRRRATGEGPG